jgi:nucleotide-binding universal stress UspA family protein
MYETIVVPVDGSEPATAAVERGLSLVEAGDATLSLLAVIEPSTAPRSAVFTNPTREALDEQTTAALENAESRATDVGVDYQTSVRRGIPHEEIAAMVDDVGADLVVMGTHGRTGLDRLLLGSVTERTLRTSDVPVLTTRESASVWSLDDILVPTDGSEPATEAVDHVLDVADAYDASVHALSVVDTQTLTAAYDAGAGMPAMVEAVKEDSRDVVEAVRDRATNRDIDCESRVLEGSPGHAITTYAEDEDVDLIAMGTHGRTGLSRLLLGSTTERTVRTSPAPVLTIPETERNST